MENSPLEFKTLRSITDLGKQFLILIEDVSYDSERARDALEDTIEKFNMSESDKDLLIAIINQGFSLNPNKRAGLRKRILDLSNDTIRSLSFEFPKYNIEMK
jgi:hypothetical protein